MSDLFFIKLGWWLFVCSALFFCAAAWRSGDYISLTGSLAFLIANISFMVSVYRSRK
jgi:F0F1-type ATP synthase assembly protein I